MFKRFWNWVSGTGIQPHYDDALVKRIRLTNQFGAIGFIIFVLSGLNNYLLGDLFSALLIEGFGLICLLCFYLNKRGHHPFTISFLFISISTAIFYFDSYSGLASGTFLYHFPLILAIAFVFDLRTDKLKMVLHFGLILGFLLTNVATHYTLFRSLFLSDTDRYQMFMFNLMFSSAAVGFFIYLTVSNNSQQSLLYEQRIREREATEKALKQALAEKEVLLAELHHRVKNNLAVIASLFNLKIQNVQSDDARSALTESRNRIKSMALIHDRLYKSDRLSDINFNLYIEELLHEIQAAYPHSKEYIRVNKLIHAVSLNVNMAVPCGMLLNELLSNCYKHAFEGRREGLIDISFVNEDDILTLRVKDNGVGLREGYDQGASIGITVIQSLSEQLEGVYAFSNEDGTCFELSFRNN